MDKSHIIQVLMADDHDHVFNSLQLAFEMVPTINLVGRAKDGLEAVKMAGELMPDVILMDLIMPEMDGLTATRIIRQQYPLIKIIVLTASTLELDRQESLAAGAHLYIRKEISIDELFEQIHAVMH